MNYKLTAHHPQQDFRRGSYSRADLLEGRKVDTGAIHTRQVLLPAIAVAFLVAAGGLTLTLFLVTAPMGG